MTVYMKHYIPFYIPFFRLFIRIMPWLPLPMYRITFKKSTYTPSKEELEHWADTCKKIIDKEALEKIKDYYKK